MNEDKKENIQTPQKIKSITELNYKSEKLADEAIKATKNRGQAVLYARETYPKNILHSYYTAGDLTKSQMIILDTDTSKVRFSIDNMVKNKITHPEITLNEYKKIPKIIKTPDKFRKSNTHKNSILLFKENRKYYQLVIKSTINKKENYITSFIRIEEKRYLQALK